MPSLAAVAESKSPASPIPKQIAEKIDAALDSDGGAEHIRQLILELAVSGALLDSQAEEASAHAAGEPPGPLPFAVPPGWQTKTVGELAVKLGAGSTPLGGKKVYESSGVKFLRSQNVWNDGLRLGDVAFINPKVHEDMSGTWVEPGDLLLNITGASIGRSAIVPDDFDTANVSQHVAIVRLADKESRRFIHLCITSPYFQRRVMDVQVGVSREGLSMKNLRDFPIPLPPVAEQKRIVAKVDQLMALCDDLEAAQQKKREVGERLTKAALAALTAAETREAFEAAWKRVEGNFSAILDSSSALMVLRRALVDLAIMGAFVPGRSDDGEAPSFAESDVEPRPLPRGWRWSRIAAVSSHIVDCPHSTPKYGATGHPAIRTADVVPGQLLLDRARLIDEEQYGQRIKRLEPAADDILYSREGERLGIAACVPRGVRLCMAQRMMLVRAKEPMFGPYLMWAMNSQFVYQQAVGDTGGSTSPHINVGDVRRFLVPVPPPPQQRRIVEGIEAMLKLCGDLELRVRQRDAKAEKLADALVAQAVAS